MVVDQGSEAKAEHVFLERVVPGESDTSLYFQHLERYRFASRFVLGRDLLDVACGCGYAAPLLCGAGARSYLGVDISVEAIALAEARYRTCDRIRFLCDDACLLSRMNDRTVDVAISFETVEHLDRPRSFLANVHRVLRREGLLVISTPNRYLVSPGNRLEDTPANPHHFREWNKPEFLRLLEEFFEVRGLYGQGIYPAWRSRVLHHAGKRGWMRWVAQGCAMTRRVQSRLSSPQERPVCRDLHRVQPLHRWEEPLYLVCVAAPRAAAGSRAAKVH